MRRIWLTALWLPALSIAQSSGGSFSITDSSVDPATAELSGGSFALHATVGQPATAPVDGGSFELTGGFNAIGPNEVIFTNGFEL
jgi:hypothetical protein